MNELALLLTGAAIALVSGIITVTVQHVLSLRADRIKRERDKKWREVEELRQALLQGAKLQHEAFEKILRLEMIAQDDLVELQHSARRLRSFKPELWGMSLGEWCVRLQEMIEILEKKEEAG